jgi:hypothetical protein
MERVDISSNLPVDIGALNLSRTGIGGGIPAEFATAASLGKPPGCPCILALFRGLQQSHFCT